MARSRLVWLIPLVAIGLFLSIALRQLWLPGFYYDEGFDLVPMMALLRGETPELLRGIGLQLGGLHLPLMKMDYLGSLTGYVTLPFLAVFGPGVVAARLQPITFSCVTIVLAFILARRWFGLRVAALTALLLAVNPSFIWFSRQGITVTSTMTVFSLGSLLALDVARARGKPRGALIVAGLLAGLGLWAKFVFMWWLALLGMIGLIWLVARGRSAMMDRLRWAFRALPWIALGFVLGAGPLIAYNLIGLSQGVGAPTINLLLGSLTGPTQYGLNNSAFLENLSKRLADFEVFLNGSYFWYNGVPYGNVYALPWLLAAAVLVCALAARQPGGRKILAVLACILVYLPISSFTVSGLWATHIFVLLPLPQLIMAAAAVWLAEAVVPRLALAWRNAAVLGLAFALLALPFARDLWVSEQHHATLARTGGSGRFSDAIYTLADWLKARGAARPVALDWGIQANLEVVSGGAVRPTEAHFFSGDASDAFKAEVRGLLADPDRLYVVLWSGDATARGFAVFDHRAQFEALAREVGRTPREVFVASERGGLPVYVVLQAR